MTLKILKSNLPADFEVRVARHALELRNWRAHDQRVREDEKNKVTGIEKHIPHPAPREDKRVEDAVNDAGEADYSIVDDSPAPPTQQEILASKKNALMSMVLSAESKATAAVIPPAKWRAHNLRLASINAADAERAAKMQQGIIAKVASAVGITKPIDIASELKKQRPADDTDFLIAHERQMKVIAGIGDTVAQALSDIDDLTLDNIDAWKMPDFPK